jgi:hypothetical protein
MKRTKCAAVAGAAIAMGLGSTSVFAAAFTAGNLVVSRVGDGSATLSGAATAVFLDEFTTAGGSAVQSIGLPNGSGAVPTSGNRWLTDSGTATSDGTLTRSVNGAYLTIQGYNAPLALASVAGTTSAANNRVIALVAADGTIDTTTALTDAYSGNNIRSSVTTDGTQFWTGGTGTNPGVRYVASLGATTSTQLSTSVTNVRDVNIFGGQLYTSSASGTFQGVATVGSGEPTTSGQTISLLPGFPTSGTTSNYDYVLADANTLYVADDRALASGGGLQKWVLSGGTWSLDYTITAGLTNLGLRGLTGTVSGGVETLYATTADQDGVTAGEQTSLVTITDTLSNTTLPASTFTTLATAPTNEAFRGVDFAPTAVPEPASIGLVALAGGLLLNRRNRRA